MSDEPRDRERAYPPKIGRDPICDICGKSEHDCRRTRPDVSGHTYVARRRLLVVDKRSS